MTQVARPTLADLPMLTTPKQAADVMCLTEMQVRGLIRCGRMAHVLVGKRLVIPRDAIDQFIHQNTVQPCRVETQVPGFAFSKSEDASTSSGLKMAAAGSAARALQIASSLKSRSPSSSTSVAETPGRVIPLQSS